MVSAWRNFKNIFPRPLVIIIFRPEMLKFHQYSILKGDNRVEFVIYCVLKALLKRKTLVVSNYSNVVLIYVQFASKESNIEGKVDKDVPQKFIYNPADKVVMLRCSEKGFMTRHNQPTKSSTPQLVKIISEFPLHWFSGRLSQEKKSMCKSQKSSALV